MAGEVRTIVSVLDRGVRLVLCWALSCLNIPLVLAGDMTVTSGGGGDVTITAPVGGGSGTVTAISAGTGLSGGTITTSGTLSVTPEAIGPTELDETANYTWSGTHAFTSGTLRLPNSTTLPTACTVGDTYMDTDATSGQRIYACQTTGNPGTWALQGDGGGGGSGTVTSITAGTGLTGGTITTSGTIDVDVGTSANKIVQLDVNGKLPAVDGSQLTNISSTDATRILRAGDTAIGDLAFATGKALQTGTSLNDTLLLQAYDTDPTPGYVTLATLTAGATPTLDLAAGTTLGGAAIQTGVEDDIPEAGDYTNLTGGTGLSHAVTGTLALDYSTALSGDVSLAAHNAIFGQSGLIFEGATDNTFETFVSVTDPTADRTVTIPDADSTTIRAATCTGTDKVSAISAAGVVTCAADAGGGSGTVTSVSVTSANGVSGTVDTATTTPAITLALGAISPTTVNALTLASQLTGFTIAGGTTAKTLTVGADASVAGPNTGDQDLSGLVPKTTTVNGQALSANVAVTAADVGLGSVENTALSTWAGSTALTTLGTIGTGTWSASAIDPTKGGTGQTSYAAGDVLYASAADTLAALPKGLDGKVLKLVSGLPSWADDAGGAASFDAITAGTNANALVIGTNGSLTVSGSGTITGTDLTCTDCIGTTEITDDYVLNTGDTMTGALTVDGSADAIQLVVQGHSTQSTNPNLFVVEQSDGTDQFVVTNAGNVTVAGDLTITGDNIDATTETNRFVFMANGSTYAPEAIDLGTDTTGSYAAGDGEAGNALTGDSATAFFANGTIEDTRLPATMDSKTFSTYIAIPSGTAPVVDAAGKIAEDTNEGQLIYGATPRVIPYRFRKCGMYENLTANDTNMLLWNAEKPITVVAASCKTSAFTTQPTLAFEDDSGNAMTGAPTCGTAGTWANVTAANQLVAAEGLRFDVTGTAPAPVTGTQALICFTYTEDRQ